MVIHLLAGFIVGALSVMSFLFILFLWMSKVEEMRRKKYEETELLKDRLFEQQLESNIFKGENIC